MRNDLSEHLENVLSPEVSQLVISLIVNIETADLWTQEEFIEPSTSQMSNKALKMVNSVPNYTFILYLFFKFKLFKIIIFILHRSIPRDYHDFLLHALQDVRTF